MLILTGGLCQNNDALTVLGTTLYRFGYNIVHREICNPCHVRYLAIKQLKLTVMVAEPFRLPRRNYGTPCLRTLRK